MKNQFWLSILACISPIPLVLAIIAFSSYRFKWWHMALNLSLYISAFLVYRFS